MGDEPLSNCSALGRHKPAAKRLLPAEPTAHDPRGVTSRRSTNTRGARHERPHLPEQHGREPRVCEEPGGLQDRVMNLHPRTALARSCVERPGGFGDQSRLQAVIIHLLSPTPNYADERKGRTHQSAGEGGGCAGPTPVSPGPGPPATPGTPALPVGRAHSSD